jgi:hypothetical protein
MSVCSSEDKVKEEEIGDEVDYVIDERGLLVFTKAYHLRRGFCCGSGCRNCPYDGEDEREYEK